jgi:hypothetical protein
MDADSRDDIVYITASGELGILYGTAQAGAFTKKILDPTLGITLSDAPIRVGGAIKMDGLKQIDTNLTANTNIGTEIDDALLKSEVYYQYRENISPATTTSVTPDKIALAFTEIQA